MNIFISYARLDGEEFAQWLYNQLKDKDLYPWLDLFSIPPGVDFDAEIDRGLGLADVVVVILSPGAVLSTQVKSEWYSALNRYLPLIPIIIQTCEIPRLLSVFNYIDFRDDRKIGIEKLLSRLEHLERDYLVNLNQIQSAFKDAQQASTEPARFEHKIDYLQSLISRRQGQLLDELPEAAKDLWLPVGIPKQELKGTNRVRTVGPRIIEVAEHFKDRQQAISQLHQYLRDPQVKLITITGRGGIGKTALVSKFLNEIENNPVSRADNELVVGGIAFLSVRTTGINLESIILHITQFLNVEEAKHVLATWGSSRLTLVEKIDQVIRAFNNEAIILLLDNFEDLLDETGCLVDSDLNIFLEYCLLNHHSFKLIITSRRSISLSSKTIRSSREVSIWDGLPPYQALLMLVELDPDGKYGIWQGNLTELFPFEDQLVASVEETELINQDAKLAGILRIVLALHRIPRAIELFIGILANNPFLNKEDLIQDFYAREEIVETDKFVEGLISRAYFQLDTGSKWILESLAVFKSPVPVIAVDALLKIHDHRVDTITTLTNLSKSHIVSIDRTTQTVALHPIDRDYIYQQMQAYPDQLQAMEYRAAQYYSERRKNQVRTPSIGDFELYRREFDHLVLAQAYDEAAQLLDDVDFSYLWPWGFSKTALELRMAISGLIKDRRLDCLNNKGIANCYRVLGQYQPAIQYCNKALVLAKELNSKEEQVTPLVQLGFIYRNTNQYSQALEIFEEALRIAREVGNRLEESRCLGMLGLIHRETGQHRIAESFHNNALKIAREIDDKFAISNRLGGLGYLFDEMGLYERALDYHFEGLAIARTINSRYSEGYRLAGLAKIFLATGKLDEALLHISQALTIAIEINSIEDEQYRRSLMAVIYLQMNNATEAQRIIKPVYETQLTFYSYVVSLIYGLVELRAGSNNNYALSSFQRTIDITEELIELKPHHYDLLYYHGVSLLGLALIKSTDDYLKQAYEKYQEALKYCGADGVRRFHGLLLRELKLTTNNEFLAQIEDLLK